jgi:hypothetical protein
MYVAPEVFELLAVALALNPLLRKSKESAVVANSALLSLGFNLLTDKLYGLLLLSNICQLVAPAVLFLYKRKAGLNPV